jgi:hypothetical protein
MVQEQVLVLDVFVSQNVIIRIVYNTDVWKTMKNFYIPEVTSMKDLCYCSRMQS